MAARGIVLSLSITGALRESAANTMALTQTNQRYLLELPLSKGDGSIWILFACSLHKTSGFLDREFSRRVATRELGIRFEIHSI